MKLTKTDYIIWRDCAHNAWVKVNRPDIYHARPLSAFDEGLIATGNEVDELARDLFPNGRLVARGDVEGTKALIASRTPVLYQPVFETGQYIVACDILVWDEGSQAYDLYEVKSSASGGRSAADRARYAHDLAFQAEVLGLNHVPLGRLSLLRLNGEYIRGDMLDVSALFTADDLSDEIAELSDLVRHDMDRGYDFLNLTNKPEGPCACMTKGRSNHCTSFDHINPGLPDYSVHDIARIGQSPKKLAALIEAGIRDIRDVPADAELSDKQVLQVAIAKSGRASITHDEVSEFLDQLVWPLSFIDYETYPAAIPRFPGYHPFDQIPFQFSLDIITESGSEMQHFEFLVTGADCPDIAFVQAIKGALPDSGSIVVWNKGFEMGINRKLAGRNPEEVAFLENVNARIIDLMDVFKGGAYVHPEFKGSVSIKAILPVLVPELSYKNLDIQEGASASEAWNRMVSGEMIQAEAVQTARDLLKYCALDTMAMVEIWRVLEGEVGELRETG